MTIFDSKPRDQKPSTKPMIYSKIKLSPWCFEISNSTGEYKIDDKTVDKKASSKRVSFADENGRLLVHVITIDRTDLTYLNSLLQLENSKTVTKIDDPQNKVFQSHDWVTSFIQPASVYSRFKSQLLKQKVKLATAIIVKNTSQDATHQYKVTGVIKVINTCFQKRVFVRLASDSNWSSSTDFDSNYRNDSCEYIPDTKTTYNIDEFEFEIKLPTNPDDVTTFLEFAVGLETPHDTYWDSNCDKNYRLDYCQVVPDSPPSQLTRNGNLAPGPFTLDYKPNFDQFKNEFTQYKSWNHFSDEMSFY